MLHSGDIVEYMGYRHMIMEEIIEKGLAAAKKGEEFFPVDCGDLTDAEIEYIQDELERRIRQLN